MAAVVWAVAVTVFMRFAFLPCKHLAFRVPEKITILCSISFILAMIVDVTVRFISLK